MKKLKIAIIGGGSSYTPELIEGVILHQDTLPVKEIVLIDIPMGKDKVCINTDLAKRMVKKEGLSIHISYTLERREGLKDADFVLTQLRVGGLDARAKDEEIPLRYQVIGQETTGPGGCFKAFRTIPVMLDICKDIMEVCPEAWLINFTNPAGIITEAVSRFTKVKAIGLCNVPINMHHDAAERLKVDPKELECSFAGLNHLSVMTNAVYRGEEKLPEILKLQQDSGIVKNISKVNGQDQLGEKMGLMLSPYFQYFYFEKQMLEEELENVKNGKGTRAQQVKEVEEALFREYQDEKLNKKPEALAKRGGARYSEAAIALINSIYNDIGDVQVVNVLNRGTFPELPGDASIEVNCIINKEGATPVKGLELPELIKGLVIQVKIYERLTIEAAMNGDRNNALLALINNPLVHDAVAAESILNELLEAHKEYLPQFWG